MDAHEYIWRRAFIIMAVNLLDADPEEITLLSWDAYKSLAHMGPNVAATIMTDRIRSVTNRAITVAMQCNNTWEPGYRSGRQKPT